MFGFEMMGNYESRKVANTEINGATIDTAAVSDSSQPFETGIKHPDFRNGLWIIVELYPNKEKAKAGHEKWVSVFEKGLPEVLKDVNETELEKFASAMGTSVRGEFKRQKAGVFLQTHNNRKGGSRPRPVGLHCQSNVALTQR